MSLCSCTTLSIAIISMFVFVCRAFLQAENFAKVQPFLFTTKFLSTFFLKIFYRRFQVELLFAPNTRRCGYPSKASAKVATFHESTKQILDFFNTHFSLQYLFRYVLPHYNDYFFEYFLILTNIWDWHIFYYFRTIINYTLI